MLLGIVLSRFYPRVTQTSSTWLILSHAYNMDGRAASHTITDKIPHLIKAGIRPIVVSSKTGRRDPDLEHYQLLPWGPSGLRYEARHMMRMRWGKDWRYRSALLLLQLGLLPGMIVEKLFWPLENQWSWWYPAYLKGLDLIRQGRIDVIYSTGGPFSAHIAGARLKQTTGLPWIAEVHDPLVAPGQPQPRNRQESMQAEVEEMICKYADLPFWFTEYALESARTRHPEMGDRGRMILPGADAPKVELPAYAPRKRMLIGHFGSLSPTRYLSGFIEAMARVAEHRPDFGDLVELQIFGSDLDPHTATAVDRWQDQIRVTCFGRLEADPISGKSGRQQVLERMRTSDMLLLQHGMADYCMGYIPSKLYEYLWMQRPILGLVYRNPQLGQMLEKAGHPVVPSDDVSAQASMLEKWFDKWQTEGLPDFPAGSPYTTAAAVRQLVDMTKGWVR